jgi:hypothetical protein
MKKCVLFTLSLLMVTVLQAQDFSVDFEDGQMPSDFVLLNEDGLIPADDGDIAWADTAWRVVTSSLFDGYAALSISWYEDANGNEVGPCDDWMILPKITLSGDSELSFGAKSATSSGDYPDDFQVLINTGDPTKESFENNGEILVQDENVDHNDFVPYTVDLADFAGQSVHIAFRNITNTNGYGLWIDDIVVSGSSVANKNVVKDSFQLSMSPNPANDFCQLNYSLAQGSHVVLSISNLLGERVLQQDLGLLNAGAQNFKLDVSGLSTGTYLVSLQTEEGIGTRKLIIQ